MLADKRIVIIGAGAWGTTLGYLLARAGQKYRIWSRQEGTPLAEAVAGVDVVVSAVSMKGVKPVISSLAGKLQERVIIVTATKGLDLDSTKTPSQLWQEAFPCNPIVVLSGPNLSKEIRRGLPAATVVSSHCQEAAELIQTLFASDIFRVYVNDDPLGTELGGCLKNVMAIAAGVCDGLQLGTNAKAALLTRALPEMIRVGTTMGAKLETFFGLSGLGDLLATCDSPLSRNYQVGYQLAQGKCLQDILSNLEGTAEGVNTTEVLMKLAQRENISVPIAHQVYLLLRGEITPAMAVKNLMARELKDEFWFMAHVNPPKPGRIQV